MSMRKCWRRRSLRGAEANDKNPQTSGTKHPDREGIGRSRGGLSTKLHIVADRGVVRWRGSRPRVSAMTRCLSTR